MTLRPLSITTQFTILLIIVLFAAQAVNLALILGERSFVRRDDLTRRVVAISTDLIVETQIPSEVDLPSVLPNIRNLPGAFFFSDVGRANLNPGKTQPKIADDLRNQLMARGIEPLSVFVTTLKKGPRSKRLAEGQRRTDLYHPRPPPQRGGPPPPGLEELLVSVELSPNVWFNAMVPHSPAEGMAPRIFLATGLLLFMTLAVSTFFVRRMTRPYARLTEAAKSFGRGTANARLDESGPVDVREAAIAFNRMRDRLTQLIEGQRTMLRAVGHDLRTPLTAMRIDVDALPETQTKTALLTAITDMQVLMEDTLALSRGLSDGEAPAHVNLVSLVDAIIEDYRRQGHAVDWHLDGEPKRPVTVSLRRVALRRALRNIIDNGLRYGRDVSLRIVLQKDRVEIVISDNGPGIAEADLERVLLPFVRLDPSRNRDTGGTGLGLSIAQAVLLAHGGSICLANRNEGETCGLDVVLSLPR